MIYNTQNIKQFDIKKYNRIFAFGCSFTNYYWPTWADLLAHENPQADYNNRGQTGAGNIFIMTQVSQAMRYFNIQEDDLVMIMWSTFYRHDAYRKNFWRLPGNIYTQDNIPMQVVMDHLSDTRGYAIRDFGAIDMTTQMLDNAKCDSVSMYGVKPSLQNYYGLSQHPEVEEGWNDVEIMYKDLDQQILPDLLGTGCGGSWGTGFTFGDYIDYHPTTRRYFEYLNKIGFQMSPSTATWANECDNHTRTIEDRDLLEALHPWYETL